ncbi:MAG TPA: phosphopyruvate hydratase [Candidatus Eisenbacteria bacterium]|nr:phosphopyruvate hydratase [Candidatus Eisenbacteria bacterium]
MAKIKEIIAREILNSQGMPTVETTVLLQNNIAATASVPSGISVGSYEAYELRDKDPMRFNGMGVLHAINTVNTILAPKLVGMEVTKQQDIDKTMIELDGTQNKARLGANSILSISLAVAKAGAISTVTPLFLYLRQFLTTKSGALTIPLPLFNFLEGGKHGTQTTDFQEFHVVPASSKTFSESLLMGSAIYTALENVMKLNGLSTLVGDEGGFSPAVASNRDVLSLLSQAIEATNYRLGFDVFTGIDAASNSFYTNQQYRIHDKQSPLSSANLSAYYAELAKEFHILYLEDGLAEDDWAGWASLTQNLGQDLMVAGDDLITTNPYRLQIAIEKKAVSAVIVKPNQIGTVIECLAVVEVAHSAGLKVIVAHRAGETNDNFIADFAVGVAADYCKFGSLVRGERIAKYNRMLQIESQINALK